MQRTEVLIRKNMTDTNAIRQLEEQLAETECQPDTDVCRKIDILNDLAWQLSDVDLKRAYALAESACTLAAHPDERDLPYQAGMAHGLRTLGYLNQRFGNHPLGLSQLIKAQEICEALSLSDVLTDVLDSITSIYGQIGDFATALSYCYRQLAAAQQIGDARRVVNAQNNLASIYLAMGDHARSIETFQQNLQKAVEIGFARIEAISLLNLAEMHLLAGNYEQALAYTLRGQQVCHTAGFALFAVYAQKAIGKIYLKLKKATGIPALEQALAMARAQASQYLEAELLLELGAAHRDLHQFDLAFEAVQQSLVVAATIDANYELSSAHLLLAEIYEQMGDAAQALAHFKQYQVLKEKIAGEKVEQRLRVLQVAHDTATAKKEAEIAHLRAIELSAVNVRLEEQVAVRTAELTATVALLQQEIVVREQAEAEIQQLVETLEQRVAERTNELATFFDLILLAGQAVDLSDLFDQVVVRIMEATRSRALCIHLFDENRTGLYLAGQQNLADDSRASLQTVPLEAGFARWMQQPNDPLVTTSLATLSLLPSSLRLPDFQTYLGAQIKIGGRTAGMLSCYRFSDRGYGIDEIALVTALAEQLGMMLETQRLRRNAEEMAVLEERQRLARDLHDSVTQSLYSLSLFSRAGREAVEDGDTDRLTYALTELERNTLLALREMRLLLYELRPADLEEEGLARAIQLRLGAVERRVGLQLDVQIAELPSMPLRSGLELYHIIVEALNNVVKHAAASHLALRLVPTGEHLHLHISDDGMGFDPAQTRGGLGLRNIQERMARLQGRLAITSAPGNGTRLDAVIPLPMEAPK
jgi:signal transduction histidine kinase